jgi:hypothetical protein
VVGSRGRRGRAVRRERAWDRSWDRVRGRRVETSPEAATAGEVRQGRRRRVRAASPAGESAAGSVAGGRERFPRGTSVQSERAQDNGTPGTSPPVSYPWPAAGSVAPPPPAMHVLSVTPLDSGRAAMVAPADTLPPTLQQSVACVVAAKCEGIFPNGQQTTSPGPPSTTAAATLCVSPPAGAPCPLTAHTTEPATSHDADNTELRDLSTPAPPALPTIVTNALDRASTMCADAQPCPTASVPLPAPLPATPLAPEASSAGETAAQTPLPSPIALPQAPKDRQRTFASHAATPEACGDPSSNAPTSSTPASSTRPASRPAAAATLPGSLPGPGSSLNSLNCGVSGDTSLLEGAASQNGTDGTALAAGSEYTSRSASDAAQLNLPLRPHSTPPGMLVRDPRQHTPA